MPALRGSRRRCLHWIWFGLILCLARPAAAQFEPSRSAQPFVPGEQVNLFSSWDGPDTPASFILKVPDGWEVQSVLAVRHGYQHVPFQVNSSGAQGYHAISTGFLRGEYDVIVRAQAAEFSSPHKLDWTIAPATFVETSGGGMYVPLEDLRIRRQLKAAPSDASTFVLSMDGTQPPLLLEQDFTERLRTSHTIEFWLRTTTLNSIVFSGWDGQQEHHYDLELVIDGSGVMRYYRNVSGEHVGMGSEHPVSDGAWHHVAVSRDMTSAWTRMYVDGAVTDSLFDPSVGMSHGAPSLAIGSRVIPGPRQFTGELGEIRLWSRARSAAEIQFGMWQKTQEPGPQVSVLSFEPAAGRSSLMRGMPSVERRRGGPGLSVLPEDFRGLVGEGRIYLSWKSSHPLTREFTIERSEDGDYYESAGSLPANQDSELYTFTDEKAADNVVYYRLRQKFASGREQLAGTLKVGLGSEENPRTVTLLGNHPNPFNPRTTISYEVLEEEHVEIAVLDLSGHLISVLVDQQHEPGSHEVGFDGSDYTSGIYFVRLTTSTGEIQSRQIVLTK